MQQYVSQSNTSLIKSVLKQFPQLNYNLVLKTLRKKDIKINGKRTNKDCEVFVGDNIQVYVDFESFKPKIVRVFEDDNILIVSKPTGVEVIGNDNDLINILKQEGTIVYACHRIDINTEGLVLLAKNETSLNIILDAFKQKSITKQYVAWVKGKFNIKSQTLNAHLKKDANNSQVFVFDCKGENTKPITTIYNVVEEYNSTSLLSIQIPTGRTHQIRAHMAFVGHPIIGDEKYGDKETNKKFALKKQCLTAEKLILNFGDSKLSYLNGKQFKTEVNWLKHTEKDK
jgi:23S rRNA pseudouridine955/2504/2580 synthase